MKAAEKLEKKIWGLTSLRAKCPTCKKVFDRPYYDWGYKIGKEMYCTYRCMREAEQKKCKPLRGERGARA